MISVAQDDVLRGLKKCKRLAKQALLASSLTSDPTFWSTQAEARRNTYERLMTTVEELGVEPAYQQAVDHYREITDDANDRSGERQALEMFFTILGVSQPDSDSVAAGSAH